MSLPRWGVAIGACLPAVLTALRLSGWWSCEVACQGGGYYQRVLGIDVLWPGLIAYICLGLSMLNDAWRHPLWSRRTGMLAGALGGVSLFYLYIAWSLGLVCAFCLSVHALVLVVLLAVAGDSALPTAVLLLLGALGSNALFHHQPVADVANPSPSAPTTPLAQRADAQRQRGLASAPIRIDYALSLQCSHCAEQHQPLLDALAPAIAEGRVRLVMRPVVRASDPGGRWLAQCALAAAARSPEAFDDFLRERLGTRAELTRDELLTLGGDLPSLDRDTPAVAGLVDGDQQALAALGYRGATPFIAIRRGTKITRYARDLPLAEILASLAP
jgi:Thioredoxin